MKSFKLDENGDFVLQNGSFVMVEGDDELAQQATIAIKTSKGDWFLDPDEGTDREPLFAKIFNESEAKESIIESLEELSEPVTVEEITFSRVNRTLSIDLTLAKEDGSLLNVEGVEA